MNGNEGHDGLRGLSGESEAEQEKRIVLILAIETSALGGSVALADDGSLLAERTLSRGQRSAQSLIPAIDELLRSAGRQVQDVELIGVTIGPGSFTGLRVGVTAAKTLAYALGAKTVGLDTLDVLAAQTAAGSAGTRLHAILDAQRQELFTATFTWQGDRWRRSGPTEIVPAARWLDRLRPGDVVTGPATGRIAAKLPAAAIVAAESEREPRAATVAHLALTAYQQGRLDDFWKLTPAYYRPSAAEEKAGP